MKQPTKVGISVALGLLIILGLAWWGGYIGPGDKAPNALDISSGGGKGDSKDGGEEQNPGIASVSVTFDDIDQYTPGTDPGIGNLFILTNRKGSQSEGALTLSPAKEYEALAGQNATLYFAEPVSFKTGYVNMDLPVEVVKMSAPTITITNDNGVTLNADATAEATAANTVYEPTVTVKAPADLCSSKHGALLVADFDKTYVSKVEFASPLVDDDVPDYLAHINGDNSTSDGFKAGLYSQKLCDGAKIELTPSITTSGTAGNEGNANVVFHWIPLNYDVNQDTYEILGPAAEDEDDNSITLGNTTAEYHTD